MLRGLVGVGCRPVVGHVRHSLRPDDEADAAFVRELATSLGLECVVHDVALTPTGESTEEQARRLRYDALAQIAHQSPRPLPVLVAHTADDQAETLLFRIIRGTGIDGLAGMAAETVRATGSGPLTICRPLLETSREELTAWLESNGWGWRDDPTNASDRFTRNRIRHDLMPLLRTFNPNVRESLLSLAAVSRDAARQTEARAVRTLDRLLDDNVASVCNDVVTLPRSANGPTREEWTEVIRLVWRRQRWPLQDMARRHWEQIAEAIAEPLERDANGGQRPRSFDVPGVRVCVHRDVVRLIRRASGSLRRS